MAQQEIPPQDLLDAINAASDAGDMELFLTLAKQMPVPAPVALAFKKTFGSERTKNSGFNFSEVEAQYGKDWLEKDF